MYDDRYDASRARPPLCGDAVSDTLSQPVCLTFACPTVVFKYIGSHATVRVSFRTLPLPTTAVDTATYRELKTTLSKVADNSDDLFNAM